MNTTDRELLERAAKAAGFVAIKESAFYPGSFVVKTHENEWTAWRPLTDDGDALRLAVLLRLNLLNHLDGEAVAISHLDVASELSTDVYASTRRALSAQQQRSEKRSDIPRPKSLPHPHRLRRKQRCSWEQRRVFLSTSSWPRCKSSPATASDGSMSASAFQTACRRGKKCVQSKRCFGTMTIALCNSTRRAAATLTTTVAACICGARSA